MTRLPGLAHDFILLDDLAYVVQNPIVRDGWTLEALRRSLTEIVLGNWHPLTLWSHMTDVHLWGMRAGPHVMTNVALHGAVAALLTLLFRRFGIGRGASAFAGMLFAFHPAHVESYAWVAERKDVLSALLFLGALHAWRTWTERRRPGAWTLALLLFVLALMSKPMAVTLPALLLVLDYWPRPGPRPRVKALIYEKLPFFALSAVASVIAIIAQRELGALRSSEVTSLSQRLETAISGFSWYLRTWLVPRELGVFHPWVERSVAAVACDVALLAIVTAVAWRARRAIPAVLVGWLWFVGMLVPVSGLVQVGLQSVGDRYLYLPGIGLLLGVAATGSWLARRGGASRGALVVGAVLWTGTLALLSQRQFGFWRSSKDLFEQAVAVHPRSAFANYLLGLAHAERKEWTEAEKSLSTAILLQTGGALHRGARYETWLAQAQVEMSKALRSLGRPNEAVPFAERAVTLDPNDGSGWLELGDARLASSCFDGMDDAWQRAQALDALTEEGGRLRAAQAALRRGDANHAAELARRAVERFPGSAALWHTLSVAVGESGRPAEAIDPARRAVRLDPSLPIARLNLGVLLAIAGLHRESADELAAAVALEPGAIEPHVQLALSLVALERTGEAIVQLEKARRLDPGRANDYLERAAGLEHRPDSLERYLQQLRTERR